MTTPLPEKTTAWYDEMMSDGMKDTPCRHVLKQEVDEHRDILAVLQDVEVSDEYLEAALSPWLHSKEFSLLASDLSYALYYIGENSFHDLLTPAAMMRIVSWLCVTPVDGEGDKRDLSLGWEWLVEEAVASDALPAEALITNDFSKWSSRVAHLLPKRLEDRKDEIQAFIEAEHPALVGLPFEWVAAALRGER